MGPATVLAHEMSRRSRERHEETHGTVWIVVQGRHLQCAPEHLRQLSEHESSAIDRDKKSTEKAQDLHGHCTGFLILEWYSRETARSARSSRWSEPRHLHGKMLLELPLQCPVRPQAAVSPSSTNVEETTLVAPNTSEPEHVTTPDETLDNQSHDMENDDNATSVPVPESQPNSAAHTPQVLPLSLSSSQLPRFRIHGKREAAVKLETQLPEEDELFVSSQLQSFREQVQEHVSDHGAEGIGVHAESGKPKAPLVTIGCHDPVFGSEVRTKAPAASRRGRNLFSWPQLTTSSPLRKETSRMRYFMATFDDVPPGELAAEPVPELRNAPNLRDDETTD